MRNFDNKKISRHVKNIYKNSLKFINIQCKINKFINYV